MADPKPKKRKMTPEEQHKLFVETARKAGAYEGEKDFDVAFNRVVGSAVPPPTKSAKQSSS